VSWRRPPGPVRASDPPPLRGIPAKLRFTALASVDSGSA
jgi:hypothetical protein